MAASAKSSWPAPPYRRQALKRRAVLVSARRQPRVAIRNVHAFRTDRRPHRQIRRRLGGGYPERALGVQQPLRLGLITPGIHRHRAAAGLTSGPDHHLHLHPGARLHHQRVASTNSSMTAHPTSSAARMTNSTKPAPGNSTTPPTTDRPTTAEPPATTGRSTRSRRNRVAPRPHPTARARSRPRPIWSHQPARTSPASTKTAAPGTRRWVTPPAVRPSRQKPPANQPATLW